MEKTEAQKSFHNERLEHALSAMEELNPKLLKNFYRLFLTSQLVVPNRQQKVELAHQPTYPNELINILGIEVETTVYVPVFTSSEDLRDWSGSKLEYRLLSGAQLCEIIPQDWSLIINLNCDVHKEFSPWELERLSKGELSIDEIIQEQLSETDATSIRVVPPSDTKFTRLKEALRMEAYREPEIERIYLLLEQTEEHNQESGKQSLLVGIKTSKTTEARKTELHEKFEALAQKAQTGDINPHLICTANEEEPALRLFMGTEPFFVRPNSQKNGILSGIKRLFS